jgi:hypothetical protein
MKCHILAHFRPISEYFDLLRLLEKCGEAPHPAKTLGLVPVSEKSKVKFELS